MNVLITGSSGFVGGFIVEYALTEGLNVVASVRKSSNLQYLKDKRINLLQLNFSTETKISESLIEFKEKYGNADYVIHNAGLTKTTDNKAYEQVNCQYTINFIKALEKSSHDVKKFTYISSMAASAPGNPVSKAPIQIDDKDEPVSAYGESKKMAEEYIETSCSIPYLILRPGPVFGPRDKDMFTVFELINKNLEMHIGGTPQLLSFIYVKDLARSIVLSTVSQMKRNKYFISDNNAYDNIQFNNIIKRVLNKKPITVKLPLFVVYFVAFFSEIYTKITGNLSQLNLEKVKELKCTNWVCDSNEFYRDLPIKPEYSLEAAITETIGWYKNEKWL